MWLSWSLWHVFSLRLIPQVLNGAEVRTADRLLHHLHSQILEVVFDERCSVGASIFILKDRIWSQTVETWDCHWLQNFISISLRTELAPNHDKPCFSGDGDAAPPHHTASTKRCYSIGAAITNGSPMSSPHLDPIYPSAAGRIWTPRGP